MPTASGFPIRAAFALNFAFLFLTIPAARAQETGAPDSVAALSDALVAAYKGYMAQMQPRLPELFGRLPKAKLEVVPMPAYMAPNQPAAFYDQGTPDGKRPGNVDVNTYNFADRSLGMGYPGGSAILFALVIAFMILFVPMK